jgi:hypothetical protein
MTVPDQIFDGGGGWTRTPDTRTMIRCSNQLSYEVANGPMAPVGAWKGTILTHRRSKGFNPLVTIVWRKTP